MDHSPFKGIRVLALSQYIASSYAASLMADLGAEVIKIESTVRPDPGRVFVTNPGSLSVFPDNIPGVDWWNRGSFYNVLNRGQLSLTLDLGKEQGRTIFKELTKVSDVVIESYTPKVMKRWELDYSSLSKVRPDIIVVSITGFGHGSGPYSDYPGTGTTIEATHGHCHVTGYVEGPPSKASRSFVDFVATWSAFFGIAGALRHRLRTGKGQWIDLGLYQAGALLLSEFILDYEVNRRIHGHIGNRHDSRCPQGCYRAKGVDDWIVLSVGSDDQWAGLCEAIGEPKLKNTPEYQTPLGRSTHQDELDRIIEEWTKSKDKYEIFHTLQRNKVPAAPVINSKELHTDPHLRARGFVERIEFPPGREIGTRPLIAHPWKFSSIAPIVQKPSPKLGEHNDYVLKKLLGLNRREVEQLEIEGVIGTRVVNYPSPKVAPLADMVNSGILAAYDPHYKEVLTVE